MKKIYGFAALAAALALTSCSNNDEPQGENYGSGETRTTYFAVNIASPLETRAESVAGSAAEYAVKNVKFVVFDEWKKVVKTIVLTDDQAADITWTDQSTPLDSKGSYVVKVEQEGNNKPAYVMTILNHNPATVYAQGTDLSDVRHDVVSSGVYTVKETVGGVEKDVDYYTMTNSAYTDTDYITYATKLAGKVFETEAEAEEANKAVNIYVERVTARVDVKQEATFIQTFVGGSDGLNSDVKFNITLDGFGFIYNPTVVNLVKDIDGVSDTANDGWNGWSSPSTFRTHWGIKPETHTAKTYTSIKHNTATAANNLDKTWQSATGGKTFYINENIVAQTNSVNPTYIVVSGDIKVEGTNTDVYQLYYNGKYYTEENAKKQLAEIANQNGFRYKCVESGNVVAWKDVEDTDIVITRAKDSNNKNLNWGHATINTASKKVTKDAVEKTCVLYKDETAQTAPLTLSDEDTYGKRFRAYKYDGGKTYFYKEIMPEVAANITRKGVVRNHLYEIKLTSISGMGTPLYSVDEEILPFVPETNTGGNYWYFGATINILDWTKYSQPITW